MENEVWKPLVGWEGLYQVSSEGRVKSLNYNKTGKEGILKPRRRKDGYLDVGLSKGGARKRYLLHHLVAITFIENPNNFPILNHKNEIKSDCRVENLEWCSYSYNNTYNGRAKKVAEKKSKPIIGINKENGKKVFFPSAKEAERVLGINNSNIIQCCKGKGYKSVGNYIWYYAENQKEELDD